jgi:hypothetical protein
MMKVGLEFRSWVSAIGTSEAARGGSLFVYPRCKVALLRIEERCERERCKPLSPGHRINL